MIFDIFQLFMYPLPFYSFPISDIRFVTKPYDLYGIIRVKYWTFLSGHLYIPRGCHVFATRACDVNHNSVAAFIRHVPSWLHSKFKVTWLLRFSHKKDVKTITLYAVQYYIFVSNANKASLMCSKLLYTLLYTLIN